MKIRYPCGCTIEIDNSANFKYRDNVVSTLYPCGLHKNTIQQLVNAFNIKTIK